MGMTQHTLREAIASFRDGNIEQALRVCRGEDDATQMEMHFYQNLMARLANEAPGSAAGSWWVMHLILIVRALNRISRRSANIAEHAYFMVKGVSIKHRKADEQKPV